MALDARGRVALVTGAGRGIGRAIALGLAAAGAQVALVSRTQAELDAVAGEIGGTALAVSADIADPAQHVALVERVRAEFGDVEVLVNNAAVVWPLGPTAGLDAGELTEALAINVAGPMLLTAALLPAMTAAGWGRVVNVSSGIVAAPQMMVGGNAYAATKAALEAHTLNLAAELDGTGVTVNVFRPGIVDTSMQEFIRGKSPEEIGESLHTRFTAMHSSGALITPEDSAAALLARIGGDASGEIWDV